MATKIARIRVHPGIGIARLGNSDEFFIGPEAPGVVVDPGGSGGPGPDGGYVRGGAVFRHFVERICDAASFHSALPLLDRGAGKEQRNDSRQRPGRPHHAIRRTGRDDRQAVFSGRLPFHRQASLDPQRAARTAQGEFHLTLARRANRRLLKRHYPDARRDGECRGSY